MAFFSIFKRNDVLCLCKLIAIKIFTTSMLLLPYTFCEDIRECLFTIVPEYENSITTEDFIWRGKSASKIQCSTYCLENAQCQALFYVPTTQLCQLQNDSVFTANKMTTNLDANCYRKTERLEYSCLDIQMRNPNIESGAFEIKLTHKSYYTVYCDMETDGGGWTVFQRRLDGSVNFTRSYKEYEDGFGNVAGEFWLGNEALHLLTSSGTRALRVDMEDFDGEKRYAEYNEFFVDSKINDYQVTLRGYSGDCGDALSRMSGSKFSAYDEDRDEAVFNCAVNCKGGWWYDDCHDANPNGLYLNGKNRQKTEGITWGTWRGQDYSLKTMKLMFR